MKTMLDIAGAAAIGGTILVMAAYGVPLVQRASAMADDAQADLASGAFTTISSVPQEIPADRRNLRMVGPRFYPDPANALDLKG